jgi:sugar phosphate isomerase/epimerase
MNIEEESFSSALKQAGKLAGYIHMSQSHRGAPGERTVDWEDVFVGLKSINYAGPLVLEASPPLIRTLSAPPVSGESTVRANLPRKAWHF